MIFLLAVGGFCLMWQVIRFTKTPSCWEQAAFRFILAGSYRFSRVEVAEGSVWTGPRRQGGEAARRRG
jgi:hypothetical protein